MDNPHANHRERLRSRYASEGFDSFAEHNVLELILFYAIPRRDTNPVAHELIERFGSLRGVFEANVSDLVKVPGVGENTALLLKTYSDVSRLYLSGKASPPKRLRTDKETSAFLASLLGNCDTERVVLLCLDKNDRLLLSSVIHEGSVSSASFRMRSITEAAIRTGADHVILAHNHPGGSALPSADDLDTTRRIADSLATNGIELREHYIIHGDKATPLMMIMGYGARKKWKE